MQVVCRRCLLEEMEAERPLFGLIGEWIRAIPEGNRASDGTYKARLQVCKACDQLQSGLCTLCGCYVELRAAKLSQRCPHTPGKW